MRENYMNPLWRALDKVDVLIEKKQGENGEFDPVTLCDAENLALDRVADVTGMEQTYDAQIKASYLLGLAAGFRYAGLSQEKIDRLIAALS